MAGHKGKKQGTEDANADFVVATGEQRHAKATPPKTSTQPKPRRLPKEPRARKVSTTEAFTKVQLCKGNDISNYIAADWVDKHVARQSQKAPKAKKQARQGALLVTKPPAYDDEGNFISDMLVILGQKDICPSLCRKISQTAGIPRKKIWSCTAIGKRKDDGSRSLLLKFSSPKTAFQVLLSKKAIYEEHKIRIVENLNHQEQDLKRARQGIFYALQADSSKWVTWRGCHIFVTDAKAAKIVWSRYEFEEADQLVHLGPSHDDLIDLI